MAAQRTLYFATGSYYSGKAVLCLLERKVPFTPRLVSLMTGEQNEPWYLRINKAGRVPYLIDGDRQLADSHEIVHYIDSIPEAQGARLVPEEGSRDWAFFQAAYRLLDPLPVPVLTFGTLCHPDLSPRGLAFPDHIRQARLEAMKGACQAHQQKAKDNPDLATLYEVKAEWARKFAANFQDRAKVKAAIDTVTDAFSRLDQQLSISTGLTPGAWLCGAEFTAADVLLVILITRVTALGLDPLCFSPDLNPKVKDFWDRAQRRESVQEYLRTNQLPPMPK